MKKLMFIFMFAILSLFAVNSASAWVWDIPVCTAPQVLDHSSIPWKCVTPTPEPLVCTLPEVLNTAGDACITPEPEPLTCTAPQVLNEAGDACIDVVVDPEPIVCVAPQILNTAGDACVDPTPTPTPEPLVCTEPQILNESGDACIDPVVEPIVCVEPQTLVDGVCTDPVVVVDPTPEPVVTSSGHSSSGSYIKKVVTAPIQYVWDIVHFGDKGENVKILQMVLNYKGAHLKVDGIYGPLTLGAFNLYINK